MEPVQAQSGSVDAPRRLFDPSTLLTAVLLVGAGSVMITVIASSPVSLYWRVLTFLFALAFMGLYYFKARQDARQHFPSDLQRSIPVYYTYGVNEEELDRIMAEFRSDVRNPGMIDIELLAITRTDQKIPLFKSWAIGLVTMAIAVILLVSPSIPGPPSTSSTGAVTSTPLELPWYLPLTVLYVGLLYIRVTWVKWRSWSFEVTNQGLTLRRIFSSWLWWVPSKNNSLPLRNITQVNADTTIIGELLHWGTLLVESTSAKDAAFNEMKGIPNAEDVKQTAENAINHHKVTSVYAASPPPNSTQPRTKETSDTQAYPAEDNDVTVEP